MYYGTNDFLETESEYIFHYFKNNGYVIGSFADEWEFDPVYNDTRAFNQSFVTFDNYGGSVACDMNYDSTLEMDIVLDKGRNSQYRRCLYGQEMHNIQLNYIKQFWDVYQGNRKAFRSRFNENHEATGELIKYNDNDAVEFLEYFKAKGYLEDTIIYFISDHGQHFIVGHIPFVPDDSRLEENYQMFLHLTLEFCIHRCLQCYRRLNLCAHFDAITLTRPDPDLKVNHSGSKKHMHFNSKHVLFLAKEVHIWIRSVLILGPQYFIYQ